jgi:hypothetical protein
MAGLSAENAALREQLQKMMTMRTALPVQSSSQYPVPAADSTQQAQQSQSRDAAPFAQGTPSYFRRDSGANSASGAFSSDALRSPWQHSLSSTGLAQSFQQPLPVASHSAAASAVATPLGSHSGNIASHGFSMSFASQMEAPGGSRQDETSELLKQQYAPCDVPCRVQLSCSVQIRRAGAGGASRQAGVQVRPLSSKCWVFVYAVPSVFTVFCSAAFASAQRSVNHSPAFAAAVRLLLANIVAEDIWFPSVEMFLARRCSAARVDMMFGLSEIIEMQNKAISRGRRVEVIVQLPRFLYSSGSCCSAALMLMLLLAAATANFTASTNSARARRRSCEGSGENHRHGS